MPDLRQIIAFRNVLIHGYATVDPARVWRTIEDNLPPLRAALAARATVGETCDALREVWGLYQPPDVY